jgi:hypothetical protein
MVGAWWPAPAPGAWGGFRRSMVTTWRASPAWHRNGGHRLGLAAPVPPGGRRLGLRGMMMPIANGPLIAILRRGCRRIAGAVFSVFMSLASRGPMAWCGRPCGRKLGRADLVSPGGPPSCWRPCSSRLPGVWGWTMSGSPVETGIAGTGAHSAAAAAAARSEAASTGNGGSLGVGDAEGGQTLDPPRGEHEPTGQFDDKEEVSTRPWATMPTTPRARPRVMARQVAFWPAGVGRAARRQKRPAARQGGQATMPRRCQKSNTMLGMGKPRSTSAPGQLVAKLVRKLSAQASQGIAPCPAACQG